MKTLRLPLILISLLAAISAIAQQSDITYTGQITFDPRVRSLQVAPESNWLLPPVIMMGTSDQIRVTFDYMDYDLHYLRYSVYHCDNQWRPSQLVENEWVDGFNQADITDYQRSEATFAQYCNYTFALPNEEMRLLLSGNYLVRVYEQDDPDHILFQARFRVCENIISVGALASSNTDIDYNANHQQLEINLNFKAGVIDDPYGEITTIVEQNTRTDNSVVLTRPTSVGMNNITYEHQPQLIFDAGNEYRRFEIVNAHSINPGVERLNYFEPYYHATLYADEPRRDHQYIYDQTQHGRFFIRNAEADNSACESDYVVTHFTLDTGGPLTGGKVVLEGDLVNSLPPELAVMKYDAASGCYTGELFLKQGAYNYQYLFIPDGTSRGRTDVIEGDKFQTINHYYIYVYDRPSGGRYDRLVGFGLTRSGQ